jgi:protein SCO1/2
MKRTLMWVGAIIPMAISIVGVLGGGEASAAPKETPWGAGYLPNVTLITQDGQQVRFYEDLIKDRKVMINFIYASCQKACPLATAKLAQAQKRLGDRVGRDIFIYSITLDPEHDTPEVLKAYAGKFGAGPGWLFLTGRREDIDAVRFKLGQRSRKEEHTNTVLLGNNGTWMRSPLFDDLNLLVTRVNNWLELNPATGKDRTPPQSYADAPHREIPAQMRSLLEGHNLFQARCAACHTLGKGDFLGPDLKGVTSRREPGWLARYLAAPDWMRAQQDPIALELSARYTSMPMPNLGLTNTQVDLLISYLEAQGAGLQGAQRTDPR